MMSIWNINNIPCPPNITLIYDRTNLSEICRLTNEKLCLQRNFNSFPENWVNDLSLLMNKVEMEMSSSKDILFEEMKCLFSYLYQGGGVHKKEKYFQISRKIGKCLKRWKAININQLISNAKEMIPENFVCIQKIRLPSPRSMYFLLHRLIGSFHLLIKVVTYCIEAGFYFRAKIALGHTITKALLGYAIVARIRAIVLDICHSIAKASDTLHPYIMAMAENFEDIVTENLPSNLQEELRRFAENKDNFMRTMDQDLTKITFSTKEQKTISTEVKLNDVITEELSSIEENNVQKPSEHTSNTKDYSNEDFSYNIVDQEYEDVGESFSYTKFDALMKSSSEIIEAPKSLKKKKRKNIEENFSINFTVKKKEKRKRKLESDNTTQKIKRKK